VKEPYSWKIVPLSDIPREILGMKPWDIDLAIQTVKDQSWAFTVALQKNSKTVGFILIVYNQIYDVLSVDTLAILPRHRSLAILRWLGPHLSALLRIVEAERHPRATIIVTKGKAAIQRFMPDRKPRIAEVCVEL